MTQFRYLAMTSFLLPSRPMRNGLSSQQPTIFEGGDQQHVMIREFGMIHSEEIVRIGAAIVPGAYFNMYYLADLMDQHLACESLRTIAAHLDYMLSGIKAGTCGHIVYDLVRIATDGDFLWQLLCPGR